MFIEANTLDIHVQVRGRTGAPSVLLLHALGTNLHIWDAQAEALSDRFRVIQMDLRGHGLTSVPSGPYSIDMLAGDAEALLDALAVEEAHVAGVSLGGAVALGLAARMPARVRSLMLFDTATSFQPADMWRERACLARTVGLGALVEPAMARWVSQGFQKSAAAMGLRAMLRRTDPEGYAGAAEALADCTLAAAASALRLPTMVLVGEADVSTPIATARQLAQAIPNAALKILPGLAHLPPAEAPGLVTQAMRDFLVPLDGALTNFPEERR